MGELRSALEDALSGQGRLVLLVGEPGIGKTRTAQELAVHAQSRGTQTLWGRCYEEQGMPPYWPWVQALSPYVQAQDSEQLRSLMGSGASDIVEFLPEVKAKLLDPPSPPQLDSPENARFRLFSSISSFLKSVSQNQPLVLVLDDLHWADKPSLLLLEFVASEMSNSHLLVVGCYRDVELSSQHPLSETLARLSREQTFQRVVLRGLTQEDTSRFVEVATGVKPAPELVRTIHAHAEGNPFYMTEMIRLLREQEKLGDETVDFGQNIGIPEGVREVIGLRLNRLSDQCHRALVTASIIGREFEFRLLSRLSAGMSEEQLLGVIDAALEAHLIEELPGSAEGYQFSHALVQETLASELSASRRVRLHARIAETLEDLYGTDVDSHAAELAHHFGEAASVLGSEKLVHYSLLAGEQALATYAWEEALRHFDRGLAAKEGQPTDSETAALLYGLGRAQAATLQVPEARTSLRRAFDYYTEIGNVAQAVAVAEYPVLPTAGSTSQSQLIARALALVPPDSCEAGRLFATYGLVLYQETGEPQGTLEAFSKALNIAQRESDLALELQTLAAAADVDWYHLRIQEVIEGGRRAAELSRSVDNPGAELRARFYAGLALDAVGDREGMRLQATAMLRAANRLRDRPWLANALWLNGSLSCREGDWDAAHKFLDHGLTVEPRNPLLLNTRTVLEYEIGDFSRGQAHLECLREVWRTTEPGPNGPCVQTAMAIPMVARITGVSDWLDVAEAAATAVLSSPSANPGIATRARVGLALLAVQRTDATLAKEQYNALAPHRGIQLPPAGIVSIDRLLGLLAQTMGTLDQAMTHFQDAVTFCRKAGYRPELAWTCYDYADAMLQRNARADREKAVPLLDEALAISQELGMQPLMERVVSLLERTKSQSAKAPLYPDGLTHREMEVLRLVATGRTDREIAQELIISVKTVGNHVSNILNKTNAANRTEAATYAAHHGLL